MNSYPRIPLDNGYCCLKTFVSNFKIKIEKKYGQIGRIKTVMEKKWIDSEITVSK